MGGFISDILPSRRQFLTIAASIGITSVAGCSNGGSSSVSELAASPERRATLLSNDPSELFLGRSAALDDGTALVGATGGESGDGAGFLFEESNGSWEQQAAFDASGRGVELDGDTVMVGTHDETVSVHERVDGSWELQTELPSDGESHPITMDGDVALAGSDNARYDSHPVNVYERSDGSWSEATTLTPEAGLGNEQFGIDVALEDDTALVAAKNADLTDDPGRGAVYVFEREGGAWTEQEPITRDGLQKYDEFGLSIALSGDRALVTMISGDEDESDSVFVFERSGGSWEERAELTPSTSASEFGGSLALVGTTALVGAPSAANVPGDIYVFKSSGGSWEQESKLTEDVGGFGDAVAMSADTALVGNPYDGSNGDNAGAAYVYE